MNTEYIGNKRIADEIVIILASVKSVMSDPNASPEAIRTCASIAQKIADTAARDPRLSALVASVMSGLNTAA